MRAWLAIAMVVCGIPLAQADAFHLKSPTGQMLGPFEFREGATLSIAGRTYTLAKVLTAEDRIVETMKAVVIPEVDFRQANIRDILPFLSHCSTRSGEAGVSFVLNVPKSEAAPAAADDPFADPFGGEPATGSSAIPLITINARQISLHDTLNIVCRVAGLTWSVANSVVMVEPKT